MAKLMLEAGLPTGVMNLVTGNREAGAVIAEHLDIDKMTFTDSTATGQPILRTAAGTMKKVALELVGKPPTIIMADSDVGQVIAGRLSGFIAGAGQGCIAGTHILVHKSIAKEVGEALAERTTALKEGAAFEQSKEISPIVSKVHSTRYEGISPKAAGKAPRLTTSAVTMMAAIM